MKEEDHEWIDRYFSGRLSEEEKKAFEERLGADEELAAEFGLRREMDRFLQKREGREALAGRLEQLGGQYFSAEPAPARVRRLQPMRRYLMLAAGIALLVVAATVVYLNMQGSLYQRFAQHPPLALTEMSGEDGELPEIESAFNSGNYERAAELLARYLSRQPDDQLARLYHGITLLETNRYEEANRVFESIRSGESDLKDTAIWYLALSYVRQNNPGRARAYLQELGPSSEWRAGADKLLDELE